MLCDLRTTISRLLVGILAFFLATDETRRGKPATQTEFSHGWNTDETRIKRVQQVRKQSEPSCQPQPIPVVVSPCFIRG